MRVASGAVVCGIREAWGSHGGWGSWGSWGSDFCEAALRDGLSTSRACFSARVRAFTRLSLECFNGLLVRRVSVSRSRTSFFSVRRSPGPAAGVRIDPDFVLACGAVVVVVVLRRSSSSPEATRGREVDVWLALTERRSAVDSDFMVGTVREDMLANKALHGVPSTLLLIVVALGPHACLFGLQ